MTMSVEEHGGGCCGISHVFAFGAGYTENAGKALDNSVKAEVGMFEEANQDEAYNPRTQDYEYKKGWKGKFGRVFEAVLTDSQMMTWAPELKKRGFKIVTRFLNDNSGNYCTILHFRTKQPNVKAPYTW